MKIDYILVPVAPSRDAGIHTVLGNVLFVVGAFEHFCVSSILHMWYLKG